MITYTTNGNSHKGVNINPNEMPEEFNTVLKKLNEIQENTDRGNLEDNIVHI